MSNGFGLQVLTFVCVLSALCAAFVWGSYLRRRATYTPRWRAAMLHGARNASILCAIPFFALVLALLHFGTLQIVGILTTACMAGYAVGLVVVKAPIWKSLCAALCVADLLLGIAIPNGSGLYQSPYAMLLASALMALAINARRSNRAEEVRAAFEEWRRQ